MVFSAMDFALAAAPAPPLGPVRVGAVASTVTATVAGVAPTVAPPIVAVTV